MHYSKYDKMVHDKMLRHVIDALVARGFNEFKVDLPEYHSRPQSYGTSVPDFTARDPSGTLLIGEVKIDKQIGSERTIVQLNDYIEHGPGPAESRIVLFVPQGSLDATEEWLRECDLDADLTILGITD